jgi:hypothetical protein
MSIVLPDELIKISTYCLNVSFRVPMYINGLQFMGRGFANILCG